MNLKDRFLEKLNTYDPVEMEYEQERISEELADIACESETTAEHELSRLADYVTENFITRTEDVLVDWVIDFLKHFKKSSILERR